MPICLCMATFPLGKQRGATEGVCFTKPKILTVWPSTEKSCWLLTYHVVEAESWLPLSQHSCPQWPLCTLFVSSSWRMDAIAWDSTGHQEARKWPDSEGKNAWCWTSLNMKSQYNYAILSTVWYFLCEFLGRIGLYMLTLPLKEKKPC